MNIVIKNYFLVILGENDSNRNSIMLKRMQNQGKCVQILDRTYILIIESDNIVKISDIREFISGTEMWNNILIRLDSNTNSAWCLKEANSKFFKSIFNEIND